MKNCITREGKRIKKDEIFVVIPVKYQVGSSVAEDFDKFVNQERKTITPKFESRHSFFFLSGLLFVCSTVRY